MARPSKPWFRESKGIWYCTLDGKKVSLRVRGRENEKEAIRAWHRLFANGTPEPTPTPEPKAEAKSERATEGMSVGEVLTAFLADCEGRVKPKTLRGYRDFLLPFQAKHGTLQASALTCPLAEAYSRKPEWSGNTQHDFLGILATAFRWAERARLIDRTPLIGLRRPPRMSRGAEALVTPVEHEQLMAQATPQFGQVLRVLWSVGCRPGEAAAITAENFDADVGLVRLRDHKTAHKGKNRVLYLPPEITAFLLKLRERYPHGPLLRNRCGKPWTGWAIVKAMDATRRRAGLHGKVAYGLRHSFATDALAKGVPDAQVAALLGHSGTAMLHRHYAHLTAHTQVLRDALGRVR